jgi:formylglycine-generating enzyme required for sulfatase activity
VQDDPADVSRDANMASRVLRGGAWFDPMDVVSAVYRNLSFPDQYGANWGIRCARPVS